MRLFLGLPFEEGAKDRFAQAQGELKKLAEKGNFTTRENFHLTLVFLGEVEPDRQRPPRPPSWTPTFPPWR